MNVKLVYFAWVREKIGKNDETIVLTGESITISAIITHLKAQGEEYQDAFAHENVIRAAINQEHADYDTSVHDGDEVAFFPPMTGG